MHDAGLFVTAHATENISTTRGRNMFLLTTPKLQSSHTIDKEMHVQY